MLDLGTQAGEAGHGGPAGTGKRHQEVGTMWFHLQEAAGMAARGRVGVGRVGVNGRVHRGESIVHETVVTAAQFDKYTQSLHCAF